MLEGKKFFFLKILDLECLYRNLTFRKWPIDWLSKVHLYLWLIENWYLSSAENKYWSSHTQDTFKCCFNNNNNNMDYKKGKCRFCRSIMLTYDRLVIIVLFCIPLTVSISDHCGMGHHFIWGHDYCGKLLYLMPIFRNITGKCGSYSRFLSSFKRWT